MIRKFHGQSLETKRDLRFDLPLQSRRLSMHGCGWFHSETGAKFLAEPQEILRKLISHSTKFCYKQIGVNSVVSRRSLCTVDLTGQFANRLVGLIANRERQRSVCHRLGFYQRILFYIYSQLRLKGSYYMHILQQNKKIKIRSFAAEYSRERTRTGRRSAPSSDSDHARHFP